MGLFDSFRKKDTTISPQSNKINNSPAQKSSAISQADQEVINWLLSSTFEELIPVLYGSSQACPALSVAHLKVAAQQCKDEIRLSMLCCKLGDCYSDGLLGAQTNTDAARSYYGKGSSLKWPYSVYRKGRFTMIQSYQAENPYASRIEFELGMIDMVQSYKAGCSAAERKLQIFVGDDGLFATFEELVNAYER